MSYSAHSAAVHLVLLSVAVAQPADVSVITALLAFPVHTPKAELHPEAIHH